MTPKLSLFALTWPIFVESALQMFLRNSDTLPPYRWCRARHSGRTDCRNNDHPVTRVYKTHDDGHDRHEYAELMRQL